MGNIDALDAVRTAIMQLHDVPTGQILPEHRLIEDLEMDSLALLELVMSLEECWQVSADRRQISSISTVLDLAAVLTRRC
ncbi:acyl carrier protein [Burkholderia sp. BE17]|uniref:acyl carrier protein n=1 Tax=Burkholderia sp. BE17 TaxID=2656644 RepID=UPI00128DE5B4|nr:phosphopantetheine-binding protein [Burkholderia sp. BE17]MPV70216.1 acyl carrier protein [Burkholderia sp. BE17]